jgi:hypothetical protein
MKMKALVAVLGLFLASSASALDLACSRSVIHLNWETPVRVAHGRAYFPEGGSIRVVHVRRGTKVYPNYTELRVGSGDLEWSFLCLDAAQKRALGL